MFLRNVCHMILHGVLNRKTTGPNFHCIYNSKHNVSHVCALFLCVVQFAFETFRQPLLSLYSVCFGRAAAVYERSSHAELTLTFMNVCQVWRGTFHYMVPELT